MINQLIVLNECPKESPDVLLLAARGLLAGSLNLLFDVNGSFDELT
jgi:hypothetical protein